MNRVSGTEFICSVLTSAICLSAKLADQIELTEGCSFFVTSTGKIPEICPFSDEHSWLIRFNLLDESVPICDRTWGDAADLVYLGYDSKPFEGRRKGKFWKKMNDNKLPSNNIEF